MRVSLEKLVNIVNGKLLADTRSEPDVLSGISTDSRKVQDGDIFFALIGENFDAHDFIGDVGAKGARAVVVSKPVVLPDAAVIQVDNTLEALGMLATWWRSQNADIPVSAIVGSSGKTTTKEMAGEILARFYKLLTTKGNLNNLIGLPQTMFDLQSSHEAAVLELGMNCPEENRKLMAIAQPNCVALTNINHAHIGMFDSVRAHYQAEAEPIQFASPDALLIINADDPLSCQAYVEFGQGRKVWRYSTSQSADFYAKDIEALYPYGYEFVLCNAKGESAEVTLKAFGRHNVSNAVAAAAVAAFHEISLEDTAEQLSMFRPRYNRSEVEELDGIFIIKDYYNAIPAAVISALNSLSDLEIDGRRFAVLGDMMELGEHEQKFHEDVAEAAAEADLTRLYTVGERGRIISRRATELGVDAQHFDSMEKLSLEIKHELRRGDILFIKGSRALRMEQLFDLLKKPVTVF